MPFATQPLPTSPRPLRHRFAASKIQPFQTACSYWTYSTLFSPVSWTIRWCTVLHMTTRKRDRMVSEVLIYISPSTCRDPYDVSEIGNLYRSKVECIDLPGTLRYCGHPASISKYFRIYRKDRPS